MRLARLAPRAPRFRVLKPKRRSRASSRDTRMPGSSSKESDERRETSWRQEARLLEELEPEAWRPETTWETSLSRKCCSHLGTDGHRWDGGWGGGRTVPCGGCGVITNQTTGLGGRPSLHAIWQGRDNAVGDSGRVFTKELNTDPLHNFAATCCHPALLDRLLVPSRTESEGGGPFVHPSHARAWPRATLFLFSPPSNPGSNPPFPLPPCPFPLIPFSPFSSAPFPSLPSIRSPLTLFSTRRIMRRIFLRRLQRGPGAVIRTNSHSGRSTITYLSPFSGYQE